MRSRRRCLAVAHRGLWQHDVSHVIDASFDHDKVVEILAPTVETYNKEATPSADATIAYDERINLVVVKDEVYGNQVDAEAFISKVDECLASLEPTYQSMMSLHSADHLRK